MFERASGVRLEVERPEDPRAVAAERAGRPERLEKVVKKMAEDVRLGETEDWKCNLMH